MSVEFVYFDLGNVILHFDHEIAIGKISTLADVSPDVVRRILFEEGLEEAYERGDVDSDGFHRTLCEKTGCEEAGRSLERDALLFACSDMFTLNTPIVPVIAHLSASNKRLGILSNTCEAHWEFCRRRFRVLEAMFDVHALSYELNTSKPEPAIYSKAAELAGVDAEKIFFVDDREENVAAALEAGYQAFQFHNVTELAKQLRSCGLRMNY